MIRENILEYFEEGKKENFCWQSRLYLNRLNSFNVSFRSKNLGKLHLPTGRIVASDPLSFTDQKPFLNEVKKGSYDVILSIARISEPYKQINVEQERVAFSMLKFNNNPPVCWELAFREDDDISKLSEGKFFGYGVDSGTGCFMDVESQKILNDLLLDEEYKFFDILVNQIMKNSVSAWGWINYDFEGLSNNNLIAFSSGWGDGGYASYFGFDENDQPACLVTDFKVVRDSDEEIL